LSANPTGQNHQVAAATAHATQTAGVRRLKPIGDFAHTITFDNGKEFAAHQDIAHALKAKISLATLLSRMGGWLDRKHQGSHPRLLPGADFYTIANPKVANSSVC